MTDTITIKELHRLTGPQVSDMLSLMHELDPEINVTEEMLGKAVSAGGTHLFAAVEEDGRIVGAASLCVFESPTGRKASVEDVVVAAAFRGRGIGRMLMEAVIGYARRTLAPVDLHLTSRPHRVAANRLYRSLGFERRETNAYRLLAGGGPPGPEDLLQM